MQTTNRLTGYLKKGIKMSHETVATSKKSTAKAIKSKPVEATPAVRKRAAKSSVAEMSGAMQGSRSEHNRHDMIATAAYFRAERRGFNGGCEIEDWLAAEAEVDAMMYH